MANNKTGKKSVAHQLIIATLSQELTQEYRDEIVASLWRQLAAEYGRGFKEKNLRRIMQFPQVFPDVQIISTPWRQL